MAKAKEISVSKEPYRISVEVASNGYILTERYGENPRVAKDIKEALRLVESGLKKGK